ncbi:MAG: A24 family peptidase [Candidatus ainarchaeum sp.]|nr:A24 family peptidase [Candidatus ainarchaeum sp.]
MIALIESGILIISSLIASYTDAKTGYIYDWLTLPLIFIGLIISIFIGLTQNNWFNLVSGILIFIFLLITYKLGKIGGGDVKLFTAIALLNPFNNIYFLISIFFISAISALVFYSTYYFIKCVKIGFDFEKNKKGIFNGLIIIIFFIVYSYINLQFGIIKFNTLCFFGIIFIFGIIYLIIQEQIKDNFFEVKVKLKDLEEDEIVGEKNNKKIKKLLYGKILIGEKELKLLRTNKISQIYVLRNLPKFGPFICIGVTLAIVFPEFIKFLW